MKICVAQTKSIKGDILANIDRHLEFINLAISSGANLIIFPELSITGYEPELAKELATTQDDRRFDIFQAIADQNQITIGVGVPTKNNRGICISMVIFQPHQIRQTYTKRYLHSDEMPFFVNGENDVELIIDNTKIALAICYEISIPEHSENAFQKGADVYIASVAKTADGVKKAVQGLSDIANQYSMTVLMSNSIGYCDNFESAGTTSIWNDQGLLLGQLNDVGEGILIVDTHTQELIEKTL
jgi:predicted amidohydrolase